MRKLVPTTSSITTFKIHEKGKFTYVIDAFGAHNVKMFVDRKMLQDGFLFISETNGRITKQKTFSKTGISRNRRFHRIWNYYRQHPIKGVEIRSVICNPINFFTVTQNYNKTVKEYMDNIQIRSRKTNKKKFKRNLTARVSYV